MNQKGQEVTQGTTAQNAKEDLEYE